MSYHSHSAERIVLSEQILLRTPDNQLEALIDQSDSVKHLQFGPDKNNVLECVLKRSYSSLAGVSLNRSLVESLVKKGATISDRTVCLYAANITKNCDDLLSCLLANGGNANATDTTAHNESALHAACRAKSVNCVTLLLEHNANVDVFDDDNNTLLHVLLKPYARRVKGFNTIELENTKKIMQLIFAKSNIDLMNTKNKQNKSALYVLAEKSYTNEESALKLQALAKWSHFSIRPTPEFFKPSRLDAIMLPYNEAKRKKNKYVCKALLRYETISRILPFPQEINSRIALFELASGPVHTTKQFLITGKDVLFIIKAIIQSCLEKITSRMR